MTQTTPWKLASFIGAPDHQSDHVAFITITTTDADQPYCIGSFHQAGTRPADHARRIAEALVKAVNNHDALVAALIQLLDNEGYLTMSMADLDYEISQGSEHHAMIKRARLALEGAK